MINIQLNPNKKINKMLKIKKLENKRERTLLILQNNYKENTFSDKLKC